MQIFAPAEPSHYGGGVRANQGFFFVYDGLYWAMSPPQRATFGIDTAIFGNNQRNVWWGDPNDRGTSTQGSTLDTSFLQTGFMMGQRIEFGQMWEHAGWLFSYFQVHWLGQVHGARGVQAYFGDEEWGAAHLTHLEGNSGITGPVNLGVWFQDVSLVDAYRPWGTEFNFLVRTHPRERGGMWEWFFGARYLEFDEQFDVLASGPDPSTTGVNSILTRTQIHTFAKNHLFGPQLGLRWFITNDRWQFSATGKFLAGWNSQNVFEDGVLATDLVDSFPRSNNSPYALQMTNFSYVAHMSEFSPVVELRLEGQFQLTKNIYFHAGWNGMYIGNLARPPRMIDYTLRKTSVMGILTGNNNDLAFFDGFSIGIEINR